jgi:outer membrane protein insertion porin family
MKGLLAQGTTSDSFYRQAPMVNYDFVEPAEYTIKNILVTEVNGKPVLKSQVVFYSGLSIGQKIKVPGREVSKAIENLWKQEYFSDVQVYFQPTDDGQVVVQFRVQEQPRLNGHRFLGLTNSQSKTLKEEVGLTKGMYITPNLINISRDKVIKYYQAKGYYNVSVNIKRLQATKRNVNDSLIVLPGYENFDFDINKGAKVKVQKFVFYGNNELADEELRASIKKIKGKEKKWQIWVKSKYIETEFDAERQNIIDKYLSKGYRDARILTDSVKLISENRVEVHIRLFEGQQYRYRNITWKGNLKFRNGTLDTILGIKRGDLFNQSLLRERLFENPGGFDVQTLYMDDGYLFFNMMPVEVGVLNDSIDRVIQREIRTKPGDVFSKSDIQRTMRDLGALGLFDPEQLGVNPKPNPEDGTVDIDYTLAEKPSDQIELSGGWGGNGFSRTPTLIGTAGIQLNNFSRKKLFHPGQWSPVPTGDGQKLSLRAQSNGANYQGYTFSFTEPWFGGKKPNSLSLSIFHTVNSFDFRQKTDPLRQVFMNTGFSLMYGARLKWPDDFFNLQYGFSFNQYRMKNMDGGFYGFPKGFNGVSYNPSFQLNVTRSSVSDPTYPTSGSTFTFQVQATPPISLLSNKNYSEMSLNDRYKWAEFHKWKLDAEWYTPIYKKTVLMAKARMGFLGYYNKDLGLTFFERFQVGGAGIFGFNIAATEIISQRGYDNYTVSSTAMGAQAGAPIFNKFTVELRQAITTGQAATVYVLGFAEAGDAWSSFDKYNPFQLKRAAGVGIRLFMPMFGLIGLDWAYGFDYKQVPASGKPTQVHFFIGQQF